MPAPPLIPLVVVQSDELVRGFRRISFAPQPALRYTAGQFLTFVQTIGGQEVRRSYSVLSVPGLDEAPAIGVRRIDNGLFSRYLFDIVRPGDVLQTTGAAGLFQLPAATPGQQYFFLAAGSGIAPIYSLLRAALYERPQARVVLVYSSHDPSVTILKTELEELARRFSNRFHLHLLFSSNPQLRSARLTRDGLLSFLQQEDVHAARCWFYTCGPEAYMRFCRFVLREAGIADAHIRREDFIPVKPSLPPMQPPDASPKEVTLYWQGRCWQFTATWPDTILRAAQRHGLELPYSCAAGRCASCIAACLDGGTWLAHNEVLTDADRARGLTLTCTAYPTGNGVTLRLDDTSTDAPVTQLDR
ncbi:2Fe-2S iron-sulfur cluster-binding protein [Flaviaesturariibacter terrae]